MPTLNLQVNTSLDDARMTGIANDSGRNVTANGTVIADSYVTPGSHGTNDEYTEAFRFTNVTIPQGANIVSATFKLTPDSNGDATPNTIKYYVSAQASDNTPVFAETNGNLNITNRPRSTATAAWTVITVTMDVEISVDITAVVQEIINRLGWASGNAIAIILDTHEDSTLSNWHNYYGYDQSASKAAKLDINYSTGGGGSNLYASITVAVITATVVAA